MMKKIIFAAAVVAASAFGVMKATDVNNTKNMSELQLADVEALGNPESLSDGLFNRKKYRESPYTCYFQRDTYKFADGTVVSGKNLDPYVLVQAHGLITYHSSTTGSYEAINCPAGTTTCIEIKCN